MVVEFKDNFQHM